MLGRSKKIIYIGRDKIVATEVVDAATKRFGMSHEVGWTYETLVLALTEISKKFSSKEFMILLSDDLTYVFHLPVPADTPESKMREFVLASLQKKIPDDIEEGEWDYKELRSSSDSRDVVAFVIMKKFAKALTGAISKAGLQIEAIEPETISKTRDSNAYIGLALKDDIKGPDRDVLNLEPKEVAPPKVVVTEISPEARPISEPVPPKKSFNFKLLLIFIIPAILIGILVGGLFYLSKNKSISEPQPSTTPQSSETPMVDAETEQTVMAEEAKDKVSGLSVQILNGSGTPGEAGKVSDMLAYEGFENIKTANAVSFDFTDTEVQTKESVSDVYAVIERALQDKYSVVKSDALPDASDFDIVITVGQKK